MRKWLSCHVVNNDGSFFKHLTDIFKKREETLEIFSMHEQGETGL